MTKELEELRAAVERLDRWTTLPKKNITNRQLAAMRGYAFRAGGFTYNVAQLIIAARRLV